MGINIKQRVAVVTGGASGIGRQTALTFAEAGAAVAVWDVSEKAGQELAAEIEGMGGSAAFFKVNVASQADVEATVAATLERFGRIDILINNAGITRDSQLIKVKQGEVIGKMSEAEFDSVIAVNAVAPGFIATEMTRAMPEKVLASMVEKTPVGRMGDPKDIANAYLFLSSDEASFVNGTVVTVDGGLVLGT